jgi:hypothetical protein
MTESHKTLAKIIVVVIVGVFTLYGVMLMIGGFSPLLIVCVVGGAALISFARRVQKTEVIFRFYVTADEVLRADEGRYRFEIADVIQAGEKVLRMMPDPPPLSRFALGALYSLIGDHNGAVEQLGFAAEEEVMKESPHLLPSLQLRRYVGRLRQIERRPNRWARISAAMASLERMHRERGARLLAESQQHLKRMVEAFEEETPKQSSSSPSGLKIPFDRPLRSVKAPPPISEVLNDVYQDDRKNS